MSLWDMEELCDSDGEGLGRQLHMYKLELDKLYDCNATPNPYCSDF
jgi:hypothetical protein